MDLSRPLTDRHEICKKFDVGSSLKTYFGKFLYPPLEIGGGTSNFVYLKNYSATEFECVLNVGFQSSFSQDINHISDHKVCRNIAAILTVLPPLALSLFSATLYHIEQHPQSSLVCMAYCRFFIFY